MRLRLIAALLVTSSAVATAQPATPPPPPSTPASPTAPADVAAADAKIQSATAHYANGELGPALADFAEAYQLDPRPQLLFSMARLQIELADYRGAIARYEQYLGTNPGPKASDAARRGIVEAQQKAGITPAPAKPEPEPKPLPPPATRPFYTDPLGDGLAAGGLIGGVTGLVLYLGARSDIDASEKVESLQAHMDLSDRAVRKRNYAVVAGAVGGALMVGAVVRWATLGKRERASVAFVPTGDDGWGLAALGRF